MATGALIQCDLLKVTLLERLPALRTPHVARGLNGLLGLACLFALELLNQLLLFLNEVFILQSLFSLIPFIRYF